MIHVKPSSSLLISSSPLSLTPLSSLVPHLLFQASWFFLFTSFVLPPLLFKTFLPLSLLIYFTSFLSPSCSSTCHLHSSYLSSSSLPLIPPSVHSSHSSLCSSQSSPPPLSILSAFVLSSCSSSLSFLVFSSHPSVSSRLFSYLFTSVHFSFSSLSPPAPFVSLFFSPSALSLSSNHSPVLSNFFLSILSSRPLRLRL